eukprot:PhF_6_TR26726/c1_g1_i3/m.39158
MSDDERDAMLEEQSFCDKIANAPPRVLLISGASVSLIITAVAIIALMASLYTNFAIQREVSNLDSMVKIMGEFAIAFERTWVYGAGLELLDQAFTLGLTYEILFDGLVNRMRQRHIEDTTALSAVVSYVDEYARTAEIVKVENRLHQIRETFEELTDTITTPRGISLQRVLQRLQREDPAMDVFALDFTASLPTTLVSSKSSSTTTTSSASSYLNTPCMQAAKGLTGGRGSVLLTTTDHRGVGVSAAYAYIPSLSVGVCATLSATTQKTTGDTAALTIPTLINNVRDKRDTSGRWTTPSRKVVTGPDALTVPITDPLHNGVIAWRVQHPTNPALTVADTQSFEDMAETYRKDVIRITEYLNWAFVRTTEIVVARVDENNHMDCQATDFRFNATCYEDCYRTPPSCRNVYNAFAHGTSSFITPDYRPEPVQGAFTWMQSGLNIGLGFERDLSEIRGRGQLVLVEIANAINDKVKGSTRTHLVHYSGMPPMKVFDIAEPCSDAMCRTSKSGQGIIFRRDCAHCMRRPQIDFDTIEYLTTFNDCETEMRRCKKRAYKLQGPAYDAVRNQADSVREYVDYRNVPVLAGGVFIDNLTVGIFVKMDKSEMMDPATQILVISACSGIAIAIGGLGLLLFVCRGMLNRIEREFEAIMQAHDTAVDAATAIANMDLEAVSYLKELKEPNPIQKSFIKIVDCLIQYRAYLPASLYAAQNDDDDDASHSGRSSSMSSRNSKSGRSRSMNLGHSMNASGNAGGGGGSGSAGGLSAYIDRRQCTLVHVCFLQNQHNVYKSYDNDGPRAVLQTIEKRLKFIEDAAK